MVPTMPNARSMPSSRDFPQVPSDPNALKTVPVADGKEGVSGSSPEEGSSRGPGPAGFLAPELERSRPDPLRGNVKGTSPADRDLRLEARSVAQLVDHVPVRLQRELRRARVGAPRRRRSSPHAGGESRTSGAGCTASPQAPLPPARPGQTVQGCR